MVRVFAVRRAIAQISAPAAMIATGILVGVISMITILYISAIAMYIILLSIWYLSRFQTIEADLKIIDETMVEVSEKLIP